MKVFIRTIRNTDRKVYWISPIDRENQRRRLNEFGFYVVTGVDDTLDVYAIREDDMSDVVDTVLAFVFLIFSLWFTWYMITAMGFYGG